MDGLRPVHCLFYVGAGALHLLSRAQPGQLLAARNGPDNDQRLFPRCDRVRQGSVCRLVGQILLAGKKAQERSALARNLIADSPPQHWVTGLKRVENGTLRDRALDCKLHLVADVRQRSEVVRK